MYNGLSTIEVIENRKKYGPNQISKKEKNSFFKLFIETLGDPIIISLRGTDLAIRKKDAELIYIKEAV